MSSSKLQKRTSELLSRYFGKYTIRENHRPDWMITPAGERLELDFYIEELNIAIEVQGKQHFEYVEFFHKNYDGFTKRMNLDKAKHELCSAQGCLLFEICCENDLIIFVENNKQYAEDYEIPKEISCTKETGKRAKLIKKIVEQPDRGVLFFASYIHKGIKRDKKILIPDTDSAIKFYDKYKHEIYKQLSVFMAERSSKDSKHNETYSMLAKTIAAELEGR